MTARSNQQDNLGVVGSLALAVAFLGCIGLAGDNDVEGLSIVLLIVGLGCLAIILVTALVTLVVHAGRTSSD